MYSSTSLTALLRQYNYGRVASKTMKPPVKPDGKPLNAGGTTVKLQCDECGVFTLVAKQTKGIFVFCSESVLTHGFTGNDGEFHACNSYCRAKSSDLKRHLENENLVGAKKRTTVQFGKDFCSKETVIMHPSSLVRAITHSFEDAASELSINVSKIECLLLQMKKLNEGFHYKLDTADDIFIRAVIVFPYAHLLQSCTERLVALDSAHMKDIMLTGKNAIYRRRLKKLKISVLMTRTSSNNNLILALSMSHRETKEEFNEFLSFCIASGLNMNLDQQTIVSDRSEAIIGAVSDVMPKAFHIPCAKHLERNLLHKFSKALVEEFYWTAQKTCVMEVYDRTMWDMKEKSPDMHKYLTEQVSSPWQRHKWYERAKESKNLIPFVFSNNNVEQFFGAIISLRFNDPYEFFNELFIFVAETNMKRAEEFREKLSKKSDLAPYYQGIEQEELSKMRNGYDVRIVGPMEALVKNQATKHSYNVDLDNKSCSCFRWQQSGIPCAHAVSTMNALIAAGATNICYNDYVLPFCKHVNCRSEFDIITSMKLTNDEAVQQVFEQMRSEGECQMRILEEDIPCDEGVSSKRIFSQGESATKPGGTRSSITICHWCGKFMQKRKPHAPNSQTCNDHARETGYLRLNSADDIESLVAFTPTIGAVDESDYIVEDVIDLSK